MGAQDVRHCFSVPSLGLKTDATPGRLNRINTFIQRGGVFYGQCSELCGTLHGFMPIVCEAVSPEVYAAHARKWYKELVKRHVPVLLPIISVANLGRVAPVYCFLVYIAPWVGVLLSSAKTLGTMLHL